MQHFTNILKTKTLIFTFSIWRVFTKFNIEYLEIVKFTKEKICCSFNFNAIKEKFFALLTIQCYFYFFCRPKNKKVIDKKYKYNTPRSLIYQLLHIVTLHMGTWNVCCNIYLIFLCFYTYLCLDTVFFIMIIFLMICMLPF